MRKLEGHTRDVRGVAYLPDGRLVSVGTDRTARLWNLSAGTGTVIQKGKGPLYSVDVSPDGKTIAVAGRHPTPGTPVALYDVDTGQVVRTLTWAAEDIVMDPERDPSGREVGTLMPVAREIWSLSFSANGRTLAAAGRKPGDGNFPSGGGGLTWALGEKADGLLLPDLDAYAVRYDPAGSLLAVTTRRQVRFYAEAQPTPEPLWERLSWDEMVAEIVARAGEHPAAFVYAVQCDWAPAVTFLPADGRAAIAAGSFVHLVDPSGHRKPVKVKSGSRSVTALAPTLDGRSLLVGGKPGRVEVFDVGDSIPSRRAAFDFDVGGVHGLAVAPDGLTFAVAGDRGLLVCDVDAG